MTTTTRITVLPHPDLCPQGLSFDARTGRKRWSAQQSSEFFYATPTVAYGRVFIGNTDGTMYAYGALRAQLQASGQPIGALDTLIAAHALVVGATLVTNNLAEFDRVPGLACENWV